MTTEKNKWFGPLAAFLSALVFSCGGVIMKGVPWNALAINGGRNLVGVVITLIYLKCTHHKPVLNRSVLLGAVCMAGTTVTYCIANKLTTAANAILLQYTSPAFVILLGALFLHQKPQKRDVLMCIAVLAGTVCFFFDDLGVGHMLGNAVALLSGACYSVVFLSNTLKGGDSASAFLWGEVLSAIIGLPFLARETVFTPSVLVSVLALGLIVGGGYVLLSLALKRIPGVTANLIGTIEPVLNPTWVALFGDERMSRMAIIGFVIVVASILVYNFTALRPRRARP